MVLNDNELIMKAQRGDMEAFEDLVYRYDQQVLGIAMRFTRDIDAAQDIYQEVFLRVHRGLSKFRRDSQFSTWLYRIATNVCLTHVNTDRSKSHISIDLPDDSETESHDRAPNPVTSAPDSLDTTLGQEIKERIETALGLLSPNQRLVFLLRHFEGYRLREIGSILGCAEGTVKKHLFTATSRMREQLRDLYC